MSPKKTATTSSESKSKDSQKKPNNGVDDGVNQDNEKSNLAKNSETQEKDNGNSDSAVLDQKINLEQSIPAKRGSGRGRPRKSPDTVTTSTSSKKPKISKSKSNTGDDVHEAGKIDEAAGDANYIPEEPHPGQEEVVVVKKGRGRPRKDANGSSGLKTSKTPKTSKTAKKKKLPKEPKMTKKKIALQANAKDVFQSFEEIETFYEKLHPSNINDKETAERQMSALGRNILRMEKMYGLFNKEKLLNLSKILHKFNDSFLAFENDDVVKTPETISTAKQKDPKCFDCLKKKLASNQRIKSITQMQFADKFSPKDQEPRKVVFDDPNEIHNVTPGSCVEFPRFLFGSRNGKVYNTNGLVTDMIWCPEFDNGLDPKIQHLIIAKSQYNNSAIDEHLSVIKNGQPHFACIEILEINNQTQENVQMRVIATFLHEFGELYNLKVLPLHTKNAIPLLACTQYGSVELLNLKIEKTTSGDNPLYMQLENSVMSLKLNSEHILSFDIINDRNIIVGLESGCVAEFDLCEPDEALFSTPSYLTKVHDSHIYCVSAAHMVNETTVVATGSADGTIKAFDPKDIKNSLVTMKKSRTLSSCEIGYAPSCHAFVFSDGSGTSKIAAATTLSSAPYLTVHDGNVSSVSSSKYHPFTITGGDDGNLFLCNSIKKLTVSPRTMTVFYRACKLWNWGYHKEANTYRLDGNFQVMNFSANSVTKNERTKPPGINISHCRWNETSSGINVFAFVNNAGLLVVEVLS
ncbi:hypothetical protein ACO0QE_004550 [Hanseniaspora vineae]